MITASIVIHNTPAELLSTALASLVSEPVDKIFLIDNSSENRVDSMEFPEELNNRIEAFHIVNRGYGNAQNFAIKKAIERGSEYHLVLNPDVRWHGRIIESLAKEMDVDESVGLLQPRITYPDGRLQHTCRLLPTPYDVFSKRFLPAFMTKKRMKRYLLADEAYERRFNAVYMQGSFMFFRTSALEKTGLFDERFFMYPEDIDITRRIRNNDYKAIYLPEISVIHNHAASSSRFNKMLWIHIVNMTKYFNKWGWFFDKNRRELNRKLLSELDSI